MAATKKADTAPETVLLVPRFPVHQFGGREGEWPEIGPDPTPVTEAEAIALLTYAEGMAEPVFFDRVDAPAAPEPVKELTTDDLNTGGGTSA